MSRLKTIMLEGSAVEQRRDPIRQKIYINDAVLAHVTTQFGMVLGNLFDVSIGGIAIAISDSQKWKYFQVNNDIELQIESRAGKKSQVLKGRIKYIEEIALTTGRYLKVGVQVDGVITSELTRKRSTGFYSYHCPQFFRAIAYAAHPIFFGEVIHFQVIDVMPSGLRVATSLRNKCLFPGDVIDLNLLIPNSGEFNADVEIIDVQFIESGESHLKLELAFIRPSAELLAALGEYILTFSPSLTVGELKTQGFFLDTIFKAIRLTYPASEEDWREILDLRLRAYHASKKFEDKKTADEMADKFDKYARHVIARVGGHIVGAARVVFVGGDLAKSEHNFYGIPVPKHIVDQGFVEFSRFCVDPDFRGADVFTALMQKTCLIAWQVGSKNILASCRSDLLKYYGKVGFFKLSGPHTMGNRKGLYLICGRVERAIAHGSSSSLLAWNQVVLPIAEEAVKFSGYRDIYQRIRMFFHRLGYSRLKSVILHRRYKSHKSKDGN